MVAICFLVYTDDYVIAGLLQSISHDLDVSEAAAGWLVTSYSLALAISAPLCSIAFRSVRISRLLNYWSILFVLANILAAAAPGYLTLQFARCLSGIAAGGVVACAFGVIVSLSPATRLGRNLGYATLGVVGSVLFGVPFSSLIGAWVGWRWMFVIVSVAASLVVLLLIRLVATGSDPSEPPRLPELLRLLLQPRLLHVIALYSLFMAVSIPIYTYLSAIAGANPTFDSELLPWLLVAAGLGGTGGVLGGSRLVDRAGGHRVAVGAAIGAALCAFLIYLYAEQHISLILGMVGTAGWGVCAFAMAPAAQWMLYQVSGDQARHAMALNTSCIYFALGIGVVAAGAAMDASGASAIPLIGVGGFIVAAAVAALAARVNRRDETAAQTS